MPPAKKPSFLRAKTGFILSGHRVVKGGEVVSIDDPVVKGREDLFEPLEGVVERATRAPGEMRVLPRPDRAKKGK